MLMSRGTIITDIFALLAVAAGFTLAFRQGAVRALFSRLFPTRGKDRALTVDPPATDPIRVALLIMGVMLMALGLLIFGFTTAYELMTDQAPG